MSGIALLRRLLLKQAMKKSASSSGIMSINKNLVNDVERQVSRWVESAKRQGADIDKMSEQELKYVIELNKPKGPMIGEHEVIGPGHPRHQGITESLFGKKPADVLDLSGKKIPPGSQIMGGKEVKIDIIADTIATIKSKKPMDAMKEANSVIGRKGKYKNLTTQEAKKILKDTEDHIFERDIKPDPEDFAGGGRTGYKDGFKVYPQISASKSNVPLGDGYNVDLQDLLYGGTIAYEKGPFSGGIEYLKGKNKYDFKDRDDTLQKDTSDDELLNLILKMKLESGLKARLTANKEGGTFNISKSFADGGRTSTGLNYLLGEDDQNSRVPFGAGGMGRRLFLKLMGAGAATGVAAKSGVLGLLKAGKPTAQVLTSVPIKDISGMPAWFKPLVNKVIKEGDDVSKRFATQDRQIVHKTQLPDSKTDVLVTQDLTTGNVSVDIGLSKHGFPDGHYGQPVRLEYKASEEIEPVINAWTGKVDTKGTKTKDEFWVEEAEFTGGHPENIKFEESTIEKFGEHGSNFDEVEKFATGKVNKYSQRNRPLKKTTKEGFRDPDYASGGRVPLSKGTSVIDREWDEEDPDHWDLIKKLLLAGEIGAAEGGRVPLAGGKLADLGFKFLRRIFGKDRMIEMRTRDPEMYQGLLEVVDKFRARDKAGLIKYMKKYLPHMDDTEIEEFIIGSGDIAGVHGQLIRLGSGRDYKAKIEMIKKLEKNKTLRDFDVRGRKPNASGGIAGMLGE